MLEKFLRELSALNLRAEEYSPSEKSYSVIRIVARKGDESAMEKFTRLLRTYGSKIGVETSQGVIPLGLFQSQSEKLVVGKNGEFLAPAQMYYLLFKSTRPVKFVEIGQ